MQQQTTKGKTMMPEHSPNESTRRLPYQPPSLTCHGLSVITLGGTPGIGDSSPANTNPPIAGLYDDRSAYDDYSDNDFGP